MAYTVLPLPTEPNMQVTARIDDGLLRMWLRTTESGLFVDADFRDIAIMRGRLALNRVDLNTARYQGLPEALWFIDLIGDAPPCFTGFGTRFLCIYGDPPNVPTDTIQVSTAHIALLMV